MTRKDYIAIAEIIRNAYDQCPPAYTDEHPFVFTTISNIQAGLANIFAADNPLFDRGKFDQACAL